MDIQGDQFLRFKWVPPSMELAEEYKMKETFGGGTARVYDTDVTQAADLSIGIYIIYLLIFCKCFFLRFTFY